MSNPGVPESQLTAESVAETGESFGDLLSQYDKSHSRKTADGGKQLLGTVIVVTADSVFLDIGFKSEGMLSELFGMEWWKVHDEAERLEHAVSPDFEAKLLAKLGKAGVCPHGNLSEMESPASRRNRGLLLLSDAAPGVFYSVSGIYERDRHLLEFLEQRGIRPGAKVHVA